MDGILVDPGTRKGRPDRFAVRLRSHYGLARSDLHVERTSEAVGPRLQSATVELVDGRIVSGYFDFGKDDDYRFEPGYASMEDDDWFCSEVAVNADWYVYDC